MLKMFAVLVTLFLLPFCGWAVKEFAQEYGRDGWPKGLVVAWCCYTIGGGVLILFCVWGAALDLKLQ